MPTIFERIARVIQGARGTQPDRNSPDIEPPKPRPLPLETPIRAQDYYEYNLISFELFNEYRKRLERLDEKQAARAEDDRMKGRRVTLGPEGKLYATLTRDEVDYLMGTGDYRRQTYGGVASNSPQMRDFRRLIRDFRYEELYQDDNAAGADMLQELQRLYTDPSSMIGDEDDGLFPDEKRRKRDRYKIRDVFDSPTASDPSDIFGGGGGKKGKGRRGEIDIYSDAPSKGKQRIDDNIYTGSPTAQSGKQRQYDDVFTDGAKRNKRQINDDIFTGRNKQRGDDVFTDKRGSK